MSQTAPIQFDSVFSAPIVRAQFDVQLVLAEIIGPALPDLYSAATNWDRVVIATVESVTSQIPKVQRTADANYIWGRVLLDLDVTRLNPKAAAVVASITTSLDTAVTGPYDGGAHLQAKHNEAVEWIRDLGARRGLVDLQNATAFPIHAHYNPKGDDYCASSSLFANEIGWNLQLVERSLFGTLILDMLFEHEYLSHLIPRNNFLSKNVREIWLSAALFREHVHLPGAPATKQVRKYLWEKFRRELGKDFDPRDLEFFGPLQLDELANQIRFTSEAIFWDITKAILECADGRKNADIIDDLLRELLRLSLSELQAGLALPPGQWELLQEFHDCLGI